MLVCAENATNRLFAYFAQPFVHFAVSSFCFTAKNAKVYEKCARKKPVAPSVCPLYATVPVVVLLPATVDTDSNPASQTSKSGQAQVHFDTRQTVSPYTASVPG